MTLMGFKFYLTDEYTAFASSVRALIFKSDKEISSLHLEGIKNLLSTMVRQVEIWSSSRSYLLIELDPDRLRDFVLVTGCTMDPLVTNKICLSLLSLTNERSSILNDLRDPRVLLSGPLIVEDKTREFKAVVTY